MNTYSFKMDADALNTLYAKLQGKDYSCSDVIERQYRLQDCVLTVYRSHKVVLQGKDAESYAALLQKNTDSDFTVQAGSDEVGTGDFFGPICVCASYIDEQTYDFLKTMRFDDSKKLTDDYILSIIPEVIDRVPHSLLILENRKYNEVIRDNNMNRIKARMHNQAYVNLKTKYHLQLPELIVVDDFCGEEKYYQYLSEEKETIRGITFKTKAESQYLSVAVSSMICRCSFLKAMKSLSEHYEMEFVKGAGEPADAFARRFVERYGRDELVNVAKLNFKNMQKL